MALGAYAQLDTIDVDARYHAAVLRLQTGDVAGAAALADTILAESPGHLFGYIVRGTAARWPATRRRAGPARVPGHYDREMAAERPEYRDHEPVIEEFKTRPERESAVNGQEQDRDPSLDRLTAHRLTAIAGTP